MTRGTLVRLGFALVLAAAAAWVLTHRELFDIGAIEPAMRKLGVWAPAGFVLVYAVGTVLFFSGAILSLAGGALFGPVWGTLWNLLGATLGATVAFLLARGIAAEWVTRRLGGRLRRLIDGVTAEGWRFVALGSEPNFACSGSGGFDSSSLSGGSGEMAHEFWLNDKQWAVLEPLIPQHRRGVKPRNNRRVISGIVHVLRYGCRWRDCPGVYGPHTTVYNRFNRWSKDGIWQSMWESLVQRDQAHEAQAIDSTTCKAHRCAAGGKATVLAVKRRFGFL